LPNFLRPGCQQCKLRDSAINKFIGKRFKAAQVTHERFLICPSAKIGLSKSIFCVKNCPNLSNFFFIEEYKFRTTFYVTDSFNNFNV
jgi:hypothetical protein